MKKWIRNMMVWAVGLTLAAVPVYAEDSPATPETADNAVPSIVAEDGTAVEATVLETEEQGYVADLETSDVAGYYTTIILDANGGYWIADDGSHVTKIKYDVPNTGDYIFYGGFPWRDGCDFYDWSSGLTVWRDGETSLGFGQDSTNTTYTLTAGWGDPRWTVGGCHAVDWADDDPRWDEPGAGHWYGRGFDLIPYEPSMPPAVDCLGAERIILESTPSTDTPDKPIDHNKVVEFVTRLYQVCLERAPDTAGLNDWVHRLESKEISGAQAAYGFVFSNEFKGKNYCNTDYAKQLYRAFMGREFDQSGLDYWVNKLGSGTTREEVFNGFSQSTEFTAICNTYGITLGDPIAVPQYGTVPTGNCSVCGAQDGVTAFVTRLYSVCLDRKPDTAGLKDWTNKLWSHAQSGRDVAYGFIFSKEFTSKKYSNADYVEYLYKAFMDRSSDAAGKADWLNRMKQGWTREQVFDGFIGSQEFTKICNSYGIVRG